MTAVQQEQQQEQVQELRLPPRPLIRTFWALHRLAYRITGGRFGLSRPVPGVKFGMMRVHSVGRRSGRSRVAIIGYYEDGANLVTLAMNGWGSSDPAWWLNLQANPETVVDLADGRRSFKARAATAEERTRLWAEFDNYPGWGADIDALAGRRPKETTIVVFEPAPAAARPRRSFRPRLRHLWVVPGLAIAVFANGQAPLHGVGIAALIAIGIAPHVPALLPRSNRLFNALHHPVPPMALFIATVAGILPPVVLVVSLVWLSHIVVDWALGDGVRHADGSRRGWLA